MAYGPTCTHTYYKWEKNYTIHLTVRDDKGNVNTSSCTIRIELPPVEPVYVEHHTNLPEMNGLTYAEVSSQYGITSITGFVFFWGHGHSLIYGCNKSGDEIWKNNR